MTVLRNAFDTLRRPLEGFSEKASFLAHDGPGHKNQPIFSNLGGQHGKRGGGAGHPKPSLLKKMASRLNKRDTHHPINEL